MQEVKNAGWSIIKKSLVHLLLFVVIIVGYIFYKVNIFPVLNVELQQTLRKYIMTLMIVAVVFVIQRIIGVAIAWYRENITAKTETKLDDDLLPLVRRTINIVIWIIAILIILPLYGINITALVTALGVSSLAIALAAQDTIANIIAGFLIMIDRPFQVGDQIKLPTGEMVSVLDIGIRRSRFAFEDKAIIIVPNADLSKKRIINFTYGETELK